MAGQTLQQSKGYENNQLQWGITERVFEIKPENRSEDMDYWFGKNKITASTQIRGIRFRGIRTTQDVGDSVKWKMFEDTLQNWDIRYDNVDRKIKVYSTDYTDFSYIPLRDPTVSRLEWEYVIYNWILYQCLDSSNSWIDPVTWEWILWKAVISTSMILPADNTNQSYVIWWYSLSSFAQTIMVDIAPITWWSDLTVNVFTSPWEITSAWYYMLNFFCQVWPREWWTDIYSELTKNTLVIDRCNRYSPNITASSSWWITTIINQWIIENDTLQMTRSWYCNKGDNIDILLYHNRWWNNIDISDITLQITRLF